MLEVSWVLRRGEKGSWTASPGHPVGPSLPGCDRTPWAAFPELLWDLPPAEVAGEEGSPLQARPPPSEAQKPCGAVLAFITRPVWVEALPSLREGGCSSPTSALAPSLVIAVSQRQAGDRMDGRGGLEPLAPARRSDPFKRLFVRRFLVRISFPQLFPPSPCVKYKGK